MGKVVVTEEYLQDIADAIREKGGTGTFTPREMGDAIRNLSGGSTRIFHGYENAYKIDTTSAVILDTHSESTLFSEYVSTSDYATFTALRDFIAIITYGVMQSTAHTSTNTSSCGFYLNDTEKEYVRSATADQGSTGVGHYVRNIKAGDTFFWSSHDGKGWSVRMGALDLVDADISGYVEPGWE